MKRGAGVVYMTAMYKQSSTKCSINSQLSDSLSITSRMLWIFSLQFTSSAVWSLT